MPFKKSIVIIFITVFASIICASASANITGTYSCRGTDLTQNPSNFTQKMVITQQGDTYQIFETNAAGVLSPYQQFGIRTGDVLSIAFQSTESKTFGVQVYKIKDKGKKLIGPFIYEDKFNLQGIETCEKISDNMSLK